MISISTRVEIKAIYKRLMFISAIKILFFVQPENGMEKAFYESKSR